MAQIIEDITVEVVRPNLFQAVVAKQNDCNSRFLKATFVNKGKKIDITQASKVTLNTRRPDGSSKSFEGVINADSTVTVPLHSWVLELEGTLDCDISTIDENGEKLTSTKFLVFVEKAACSSDEIVNDPQYDVLTDLIKQVEALGGGGNPILEAGTGNKSIQQALDATSWAPDSSQTDVLTNAAIKKDGDAILTGAFGDFSAAMGGKSQATGKRAFAEGTSTIALGNYSHSEGNKTFAKAVNSHAEGLLTNALGEVSHSEGTSTIASGDASHAEGALTVASGYASHAENDQNEASGNASHAGGVYSKAKHNMSFVHGTYLETGRQNQAVFGEYNAVDANALFVVGNGTSTTNRKNAFQVNADGTMYAGGKPLGAVFIAIYRETTYDEIKAAIEAGRACFCLIPDGNYKGCVLPLTSIGGVWYTFSAISNAASPSSVGLAHEMSVWCTNSGWTDIYTKALAYK